MVEDSNVTLKNAMQIHRAMTEYRDNRYINLIQQINTKTKEIITDDMGSQFIRNCGRDIASEVIHNYFDTSNYNITVDQLAKRILEFSYENDYDPLAQNGGEENIKKSVYNYNEIFSSELKKISKDMDESQEKLFSKKDGEKSYENQTFIDNKKNEYRQKQREQYSDGKNRDDYTGKKEEFKERADGVIQSNLNVDHRLDLAGAKYNTKYITEAGKQNLVEYYNSDDNFSMMSETANKSKNAIKIYDKNGNDITHRATPEQIADEVCRKWENSPQREKLIEEGYLNKDGKVPKSIKNKLIAEARNFENKESIIILKGLKYDKVAEDATQYTKAAVGKIIAGQIIYYAAPPLVFEIRELINKKSDLDSILSRLSKAGKRIGKYVLSKLKNIFGNVLFSSLKKFIKSFMDILISVVKATVVKLLKLAKNLVLSVVDAIRIIADKNSTASQKADSVVNLFSVTITSCVVEILFELLAKLLNIHGIFADIIFAPLQILTTVVCTNLVMLILQKVDLFDVRTGFKVSAIKKVFEEERDKYEADMVAIETVGYAKINAIIDNVRSESINIYNQLRELDPHKSSVRNQLTNISDMFSMEIDFEYEWMNFLGFNPATELA